VGYFSDILLMGLQLKAADLLNIPTLPYIFFTRYQGPLPERGV